MPSNCARKSSLLTLEPMPLVWVEASTHMPVSAPLASKPMMTVRMPPSKPFSSALMAVLPSGALTTPVMPAVV